MPIKLPNGKLLPSVSDIERPTDSKYYRNVAPILDKILRWYEKGLPDYQIAAKCEISPSSYTSYLRQFPELARVRMLGKTSQVQQVEGALFKSAIGHTVQETRTRTMIDKEGNQTIITDDGVREIPPDIRAQKFFLINRDGSNWKEHKAVDLDASIDVEVKLPEPNKELVQEQEVHKKPDMSLPDTAQHYVDVEEAEYEKVEADGEDSS